MLAGESKRVVQSRLTQGLSPTNLASTIPRKSRLERSIPVEALSSLAAREGNSKRPVYEIHKWWARRLGVNFRMLLLAATMPSNTRDEKLWREFYSGHYRSDLRLLDPFVGGGTSIVESLKLGFYSAGVDIDPVAWFVTKKEVEPCDITALRSQRDRIIEIVKTKVGPLYETSVPGGTRHPVVNFFWVDDVSCPKCKTQFEGHPNHYLAFSPNGKYVTAFCQKCHNTATFTKGTPAFTCRSCSTKTPIDSGPAKEGKFVCPECDANIDRSELVTTLGKPLPQKLFAIEYEERKSRKRHFKGATQDDQTKFEEARKLLESQRSTLPYPQDRIPTENRSDPRPLSLGYEYYHQLFNDRQLYTLSLIYQEILEVKDRNLREYLLLAFSDSLASNNMLCAYAFGYRKLTPLFGLHAYRMVNRPVEGNTISTHSGRGSFPKCVEKLLTGKMFCKNPYEYEYKKNGDPKQVRTGESIEVVVTENTQGWFGGEARCLLLNQSSKSLEHFQDGTIDLILTDPPYYDNLPYSELSDFFYVWLKRALADESPHWQGSSTPMAGSLFVASNTKEQKEQYVQGLAQVFREGRRIIKSSGMMVFTYHHRRSDAWVALYSALHEARWSVTNVFPLLSEGKSGFHSSKGSLKWDMVFVCRPDLDRQASRLVPTRVTRWTEKRAGRWVERLRGSGLTIPEGDLRSLMAALTIMHLLTLNVPYAKALPFLQEYLIDKEPRNNASQSLDIQHNSEDKAHGGSDLDDDAAQV